MTDDSSWPASESTSFGLWQELPPDPVQMREPISQEPGGQVDVEVAMRYISQQYSRPICSITADTFQFMVSLGEAAAALEALARAYSGPSKWSADMSADQLCGSQCAYAAEGFPACTEGCVETGGSRWIR